MGPFNLLCFRAALIVLRSSIDCTGQLQYSPSWFSIKQPKSILFDQLEWILAWVVTLSNTVTNYSLCHVVTQSPSVDGIDSLITSFTLETRVCVSAHVPFCWFICVFWGVWHWHSDHPVSNYGNSKQEMVQFNPPPLPPRPAPKQEDAYITK